LGRRVSKTINGEKTEYLFDGNDIVAEIQGGVMTTTYLRGLNIDEPFVRQSSAGNEYYLTDALGSTIALTDGAGNVTTTYSYDPFGNTTVTGTSTNVFQYTGRENDGTGLYYYRARYYSPSMQRFISEDPIQFYGGDINLYSYVRNSPLSWNDPSGLCPICVVALPPVATAITTAATQAAVIVGGLITGAIVGDAILDSIHERGGKDNVKDTGLTGVPNDEIKRKAKDRSLSGEERRRYQKEEKARDLRNKQKRQEGKGPKIPGIIPPIIPPDDDPPDCLGARKC
jgi:RHS repeat-associated protein